MAGIKVQKDYNEIIKELTTKPKFTNVEKVFNSIAHLFIFAGAFGFHKKRKIKTTRARQDQVVDTIFDNQNLQVHIYAVALAESKDIAVLNNKDECYQIFEDYVNGGLEEICKIKDNFSNPEDFVQDLLNKLNTIAAKNVPYDPDPLDPQDIKLD